jgi:hypothetical protein
MESVNKFPKPIENKYKYSVGKIATSGSAENKENIKPSDKRKLQMVKSEKRDETLKIRKKLETIFQAFKEDQEDWELDFHTLLINNIDDRGAIPIAINAKGSSLMICAKFWLLYIHSIVYKLNLDLFIKLFCSALDFLDYEKSLLLNEYPKLLEKYDRSEVVEKMNESRFIFKKVEKYEDIRQEDMRFLLHDPQYINMFRSQINNRKIVNDIILTKVKEEGLQDGDILNSIESEKARPEENKQDDSDNTKNIQSTLSEVNQVAINELQEVSQDEDPVVLIDPEKSLANDSQAEEVVERRNEQSTSKHNENEQSIYVNEQSFGIHSEVDQSFCVNNDKDNDVAQQIELNKVENLAIVSILHTDNNKELSKNLYINTELYITVSHTYTYHPNYDYTKGYNELVNYNNNECTITRLDINYNLPGKRKIIPENSFSI